MKYKDRSMLQRIIDIMLWCIGRDIENSDGDLLLLFGFNKYKVPKHILGSNRYHISFYGYEIVLWGFGILVHDHNIGVFVNRHRFEPRIVEMEKLPLCNIWHISDVTNTREIRDDEFTKINIMLDLLFRVLYRYERWILAWKGYGYRSMCVEKYGYSISYYDTIKDTLLSYPPSLLIDRHT
jgi:hypothetical protein